MPYELTGSVGLAHAGELGLVYKPETGVNPSLYGVILAHGANGGAQQWNDVGQFVGPTYFSWGPALANAGLTAMACDLGSTLTQDMFGNDTGVGNGSAGNGRMEECRLALQALGCKPGKALVLGISHGGIMGQNYIRANPSRVAAMVGGLPLCDLDLLRDNNTGGFQAQVNTAWSLTAGSTSATVPLPTRASPANPTNRAAIAAAGAPIRFYYSAADSLIPQATITAQASALAALGLDCKAIKVSDTLDHTGNFGQVWPYDAAISFLLAHA